MAEALTALTGVALGSAGPRVAVDDAPDRIGPYRLVAEIGRGSSGVIYRARHERRGEIVALKTISSPEVIDLDILRREIFVLSRIDHAGVVKVRDQGVERGMPWYAMDFVEGQTLDCAWPRVREARSTSDLHADLRAALTLTHRLCETLAYIHGEGIVHRDLQPGNVIVRSDGRPILVDFGMVCHFAAMAGRERLEIGGEVLGTIPYMAPEQARGEYVDARADLYSLGCILYEACTGRPPFVGSGWEVVSHHLETRPAPPSRLVPELPRELDDLVLRLLEKDPRRRFGYASDVARALARSIGCETVDGPVSRPYLYRPGFAGRHEALRELRQALSRLERRRGSLTLVGGESGAGKTRLVMEAVREATWRGYTVVPAECLAMEGAAPSHARGAPLHPVAPLLRAIADHCRVNGAEATHRVLGTHGRVLADYEPALADVPGIDELPAPAPLPSAAARNRVLYALETVVARFAEENPLVVIFDDLQWVDELTASFLASLTAPYFEVTPLAIVATYRTEDPGDAVAGLLRAAHGSHVHVGRLEAAAVAAMASDMLAFRDVPASFVAFLERESEGNPFFLSEFLRTAVDEGLLARSGDGSWCLASPASGDGYALPLPHSLRELLARRLDVLTSAPRRLAETAAAFGREFDLAMVSDALGLDEDTRMEAVARLLARKVIEENGGTRYRFAHDKLREAAYARIPPDERAGVHLRIATAIETAVKGRADVALWHAALGHHWSSAGVRDRAADHLGKAGEVALRGGAAVEARDFITRALALDEGAGSADDLRRAHWLCMLGEAAFGTGDFSGSIQHTAAALQVLGVPVPRTRPRWTIRLLKEAVRMAAPRPRSGHPARAASDLEAAIAASQIATPYYYRTELVEGVASSLRCINLARAAGRPEQAAMSLGQLGYIAGGARLHGLARRCFAQAYSLRERADPTAIGVGLYFHAMYRMGLGQWQESERLGQRSLELLESIGNRQEAEIAKTIIANTIFYQGRFRQAEEHCRAMLASAEPRSNPQHVAWGKFLTARSLVAVGEARAAIPLLEDARALLAPLEDLVSMIMCEGSLARALLYDGRLDCAVDVAATLVERFSERWRVPLAQCLDGFGAAPEVLLAAWEQNPTDENGRRAHAACRHLRRFARLFPIALPAALRSAAREKSLLGKHSAALRLAKRSLRSAERLAMPYEAALARQEIARHLGDPLARASHLVAAARLHQELGSTHHLRDFGLRPRA